MGTREIAERFFELVKTRWIVCILLLIFLASGYVTIAHVDPFDPLPNYLGLISYLASAIGLIWILYDDVTKEGAL